MFVLIHLQVRNTHSIGYNKTLDTLKISRKVLGDKVENHKLDTLANYFGVNPPTHQARDDVMATFEIYKKLLSIQ